MRILLLSLLLAASRPGLAQTKTQLAAADTIQLPLDATNQRIAYTGVVAQTTAGQAELFTRGKLWFAGPGYAGQTWLQVLEPAAGVMQGTGWREVPLLVNGQYYYPRLLYTLKLAVKDGRYRYELTDFRFADAPVAGLVAPRTPIPAEQYVQPARPKGNSLLIARTARLALAGVSHELLASLQEGMSRPTAGAGW